MTNPIQDLISAVENKDYIIIIITLKKRHKYTCIFLY